MKVAILCPGPTLLDTWKVGNRDYDLVLAVNRAAEVGLCDWWVAGDWICLKQYPGRPQVGICSQADCIRIVKSGELKTINPLPNPCEYAEWEKLPFQRNYSSIAAIGLAIKLGATDVSFYGDDKEGDKSFDGQIAEQRGEGRWVEERAWAADGLALFDARGITHRHVKP